MSRRKDEVELGFGIVVGGKEKRWRRGRWRWRGREKKRSQSA